MRYADWSTSDYGLNPVVEEALLAFAKVANLPEKRTELLLAIVCGMSYREVGECRGVSEQSVKQAANELLHSIGMTSRRELENAVRQATRYAQGGAGAKELLVFFQERFR